MRFYLDLVNAIARDFWIEFRSTTGNHARHTTTARRPHNLREIYITSQWTTGNDQLARSIELRQRLVAQMSKVGHESNQHDAHTSTKRKLVFFSSFETPH